MTFHEFKSLLAEVGYPVTTDPSARAVVYADDVVRLSGRALSAAHTQVWAYVEAEVIEAFDNAQARQFNADGEDSFWRVCFPTVLYA